jgi:hypothetical protein
VAPAPADRQTDAARSENTLPATAGRPAAAAARRPAAEAYGDAGGQTDAGPGRPGDGAAAALSLLRTLGAGYWLLCMYRCHEAAEAFSRLPRRQYETGAPSAWVFLGARDFGTLVLLCLAIFEHRGVAVGSCAGG